MPESQSHLNALPEHGSRWSLANRSTASQPPVPVVERDYCSDFLLALAALGRGSMRQMNSGIHFDIALIAMLAFAVALAIWLILRYCGSAATVQHPAASLPT